MAMNSKERVLATLNHEPTDRTPLDCWLYQKQFVEMLEGEYGSRDKFLDEFNIDLFTGFVPWPNQMGRKIDVTELAEAELRAAHDPLWLTYTDWTEDFAGANIKQAVEWHGSRRTVVAHIWGIVEGTSSFLGIENCWANLGLEPNLMVQWFDRYSNWLCDLADSLIEAGVDVITLSDDWGSNKNLLFSPRLWRGMIAPYAGRVVKHIRARGVPVNLHSDGYIMTILDDIVAMGYASVHPVQESAGMDPRTVKQKYGDKLVVYGSLDIIDGLLAYDGQELDDYITRHFEIYAPGGGFIFNTGHFVQPDIPTQRLIRAYTLANELAKKYGGVGA
jgi:uroporphyrinogen decarboxylase